MQSLFYIGILSILWVVNLFNGTGLDAVYHVTDYAKIIIITLTAFSICSSFQTKGDIRIKRSDFNIYGGMLLVFVSSSIINGFGMQALDYLWVFCIIYLLSKIPINNTILLWTGLIYGFLGAVILYIYNFGNLLDGWNENSIAMLGMHSFLILIVPFFDRTSIRSKVMLLVTTALFSYLISPTNSRSGILFLIIATLFALNILPRNLLTNGKYRLVLLLFIPLIIVGVVCLIANSHFFDSLNNWSITKFHKPIFNGRDEIWLEGFEMLFKNLFIGCGNLITLNWHNSAIHCLTAYGIVGYSFWLASFHKLLYSAKEWFEDSVVCGCFISFLVLWIQQSVELGFISNSPSLLPYIILGLMLGRIWFLNNITTTTLDKERKYA
ncbi:MAG: O-antigen ligase family protein [Clostridia bacterium]|nr:O-antigen ligase family protein [Clostridia bacterium]